MRTISVGYVAVSLSSLVNFAGTI